MTRIYKNFNLSLASFLNINATESEYVCIYTLCNIYIYIYIYIYNLFS